MTLHRHRWRLVAIRHVRDVSFGEPGSPYTRYLQVCDVCNKNRSKRIEGYWALDELAGTAP